VALAPPTKKREEDNGLFVDNDFGDDFSEEEEDEEEKEQPKPNSSKPSYAEVGKKPHDIFDKQRPS
jgi:hypothetical protein